MYAATPHLELRAKRSGVHVAPTFMAGTSMSNDIHVDTAVVILPRTRPKNMLLIDIR